MISLTTVMIISASSDTNEKAPTNRNQLMKSGTLSNGARVGLRVPRSSHSDASLALSAIAKPKAMIMTMNSMARRTAKSF